ncbi:hypothetical protein [Marinicella sp. W31]|uniref:hypothetical protein n=1 Tax=Marinicella sp. W31 TaxID=3023713 RepID=UPI003757F824
MKFLLCAAVFLLKANCAVSGEMASIKSEADTFLNNYLLHLNSYLSGQDTHSVEEKTVLDVRTPSLVIQASGALLNYESEGQVVQGFTAFLDQIKTQGVGSIEWKTKQIKVLNAYAAVAHNIAVLLSERGEVIQEIGSTYVLHKNEDRWSIAMRIPHKR